MKTIEELEIEITTLHYRLGVIEKFLEQQSGNLYNIDDESTMNLIRQQVVQDMSKEGKRIDNVSSVFGTKLYGKI